MILVDNVPRKDGVAKPTGFCLLFSEPAEKVVLVGFLTFVNFSMASDEWRQDFTNGLFRLLSEEYPGRDIIFKFV
jgi:hypothetical protein